MKINTAVLIAVTAVLCSCASVKTYDEQGNLLGECDVVGIHWGAVCTGSANPADQKGKNYVPAISDVQALYTTMFALFSYDPKIAESYFEKHISSENKQYLDSYIGTYKMYVGYDGRYYPLSSLDGDESAFLNWLVLNHPAFSNISGGFKK